MNSNILPNVWRFLALLAVQVLILRPLFSTVGSYATILIYPLFVFFLPVKLPTPYLVVLGFVMGLFVDFFYVTLGIHASAGAFSGLIRPLVFAAFGPKSGFSGKEPVFSRFYFNWQSTLSAAAFFMVLHLFWYFAVDAFSYVFFVSVSLKTLVAWVLSMIFVVFYMALFKTQY